MIRLSIVMFQKNRWFQGKYPCQLDVLWRHSGCSGFTSSFLAGLTSIFCLDLDTTNRWAGHFAGSDFSCSSLSERKNPTHSYHSLLLQKPQWSGIMTEYTSHVDATRFHKATHNIQFCTIELWRPQQHSCIVMTTNCLSQYLFLHIN